MQKDFHYYATYCAAFLAGYSHAESLDIAYSAQFVDLCSKTLLGKLKAPRAAATTQLQLELMDANTDVIGLQDITRIWASFHFLPRDLYAEKKHCSRRYRKKYRLICGPNGPLTEDTVQLAKGNGLQAAGIAMHVLADTWAHQYFAGTPSLVINNTNYHFYEMIPKDGGFEEREITFRHSPSADDDLDRGIYTSSIYQTGENSIMNLGHGRAGHLPDYSFMRYRYLPAWGGYEEVFKNNPSDYLHAFCQMIHALKYLRGDEPAFVRDCYDVEAALPYEKEIKRILVTRQLDACEDWKRLGEKLSGQEIEEFDLEKFQPEYMETGREEKAETWLGRFFTAAMKQKSMVTNKIYSSGSRLAGISIEAGDRGLKGNRDYARLEKQIREGKQ